MSDERIKALLQLQTRQIPMPDGGAKELTYTLVIWRGMEYLVDRGYCTVERLVELASVDGWEPANAPFEMRFSSVIAYWQRRNNRENGDFTAYCRGQL